MPFKTKKRKVSASERRFTILQNGAFTYGTETAPKKSREFSPVKSEKKSIENYNYVLRDLSKIAVSAGVIIAIQITMRAFSGNLTKFPLFH